MFQTRLAGLFALASAPSGRRRRAGALAAFVSGTLLLATVRTEAQIRGGEHEIKAAFLYNLAKFVEWPPADPSDQLVIGVVGSDFFGSTLRHVVEGKSVQGREIVVRRLRRDDSATAATCGSMSRTTACGWRLTVLERLGPGSPSVRSF